MAIISYQDISALRDRINTELSQRPIGETMLCADFCWFRPGQGGRERFELDALGCDADYYNELEQVNTTPPEAVEFQVEHKEFGMKPFRNIPKYTTMTDVYGILDRNLPEIAAHSMQYYDPTVAKALGLGQSTLCAFDNLSYFNTLHLVNPNRPWLGTFPNLFAGTALNRAGLIRGFNALTQMKNFAGQKLNMPGRLAVLVGNEDQYNRAATELNSEIVAAAIGAAAASQSNSLKGRADIILVPQLDDFDGGKAWYIAKMASGQHRGITFSEVMKPTIMIEGLSPTDHLHVILHTVLYGWRSCWGVGYLWPQLMVKLIEP